MHARTLHRFHVCQANERKAFLIACVDSGATTLLLDTHTPCTAPARHRTNLSLAASVDLDVEGGGRLDEDYDGGWSASATSAWSAKGPAAYTPTMDVLQSAKCHLAWAKAGWLDANRWLEAANVAKRSSEIRFGIIKGLALSASIAAIIFFFELAFFPAHLFPKPSSGGYKDDPDATTVGHISSVFWLYPLIAGSYFLASSWTVDVAQAAYSLKHGRAFSLAAPSIPPGTSRRLILESYRVMLVLNYFVISVVLQQIPYLGRWLSFFFMSFIDAYYCFEQGWIARGWSVERRMRYAESRWAYFVAFGLPSTAISFFHPSGLLNLMLFMLVFPVCTVLAMLANPQPRQAPTGSTTLTPNNSGLSPALANNTAMSSFLPPRLPIFWLTVKSYRIFLRFFPRVLDVNAAMSAQTMGAGAGGNSAAWRQARQYANPALFPAANGGGGGGSYGAMGNGGGVMSSSTSGAARGMPYAAAGAVGGFGTGVDRGAGANTVGKRGAMAAQIVDGAWGGQGLGAPPGVNGLANGAAMYGGDAAANPTTAAGGTLAGGAINHSTGAKAWPGQPAVGTGPAFIPPPPKAGPAPRGGKKKD